MRNFESVITGYDADNYPLFLNLYFQYNVLEHWSSTQNPLRWLSQTNYNLKSYITELAFRVTVFYSWHANLIKIKHSNDVRGIKNGFVAVSRSTLLVGRKLTPNGTPFSKIGNARNPKFIIDIQERRGEMQKRAQPPG